jgi:hypothetical protein
MAALSGELNQMLADEVRIAEQAVTHAYFSDRDR